MKLPLVDDDARTMSILIRLDAAGCLRLACRLATLYGVTTEALVGRSRHRTPVLARHHLCALVRWSTGLSYTEIGALLDLDHTTIIHAVRTYEARITAELRETSTLAVAS